jgi:hypothetical protein
VKKSVLDRDALGIAVLEMNCLLNSCDLDLSVEQRPEVATVVRELGITCPDDFDHDDNRTVTRQKNRAEYRLIV